MKILVKSRLAILSRPEFHKRMIRKTKITRLKKAQRALTVLAAGRTGGN